MDRYRLTLFLGASLLVLPVAGCMQGTDGGDAPPENEATAFSERPAASSLVERDVEAPEVFQVSDQGLWDGRPSLGGVWVAYPDVGSPERVVIRNEDSGRFVIGALFKRERENPGPKLQVSSDAAAALGLLAGQPTALNVTALRREEPAEAQVAAATPAPATEEPAAAIAAEPQVASVEPAAAQANPEAGSGEPIAAGTIGGGVAASPVTASTTAADAPVEVAAVQTATKKKRNWNPFRRNRTPEVVTPAAAPAPVTGLSDAGAVTTEPLASVADEAAAAPAAIAESQATAPKIDKPYVQIGIFSVEDNANNTAEAMRQNGVTPKVFEQQSSGKTFWRVVVGPASSKADRSSLIKKVNTLGFSDAYPVSG